MTGPIPGSDLDWVIVRFITPKTTLKQGNLRAGLFGADRITRAASRGDIATFTAAQVGEDTYLHQTSRIITNPPHILPRGCPDRHVP